MATFIFNYEVKFKTLKFESEKKNFNCKCSAVV